jgi:hypothetical protein
MVGGIIFSSTSFASSEKYGDYDYQTLLLISILVDCNSLAFSYELSISTMLETEEDNLT